jgi:hypothetical protein
VAERRHLNREAALLSPMTGFPTRITKIACEPAYQSGRE